MDGAGQDIPPVLGDGDQPVPQDCPRAPHRHLQALRADVGGRQGALRLCVPELAGVAAGRQERRVRVHPGRAAGRRLGHRLQAALERAVVMHGTCLVMD